MSRQERSAPGQLVNFNRCRIARVDLDGPRNPVAKYEIDTEPACEAECDQ